MKHKQIKVKILMINNLEIIGVVAILSDSYYSRLSDLVNNNQHFLILTEVEVYNQKILVQKTPFLCINKQSILFLAEDDSYELRYNRAIAVEIE